MTCHRFLETWYGNGMDICIAIVDEIQCDKKVFQRSVCRSHYRHMNLYGEYRKIRETRDKRPNTDRDASGKKLCKRCENWFPEMEFNKESRRPDGLSIYCRTCSRANGLESYHRTGYEYGKQVWSLYRLSKEDYDALLVSQDYKCAICGSEDPKDYRGKWHVDHDHACCDKRQSCGKCIRGLLCSKCNLALGLIQDSPETLLAMIRYLERPHLGSR